MGFSLEIVIAVCAVVTALESLFRQRAHIATIFKGVNRFRKNEIVAALFRVAIAYFFVLCLSWLILISFPFDPSRYSSNVVAAVVASYNFCFFQEIYHRFWRALRKPRSREMPERDGRRWLTIWCAGESELWLEAYKLESQKWRRETEMLRYAENQGWYMEFSRPHRILEL